MLGGHAVADLVHDLGPAHGERHENDAFDREKVQEVVPVKVPLSRHQVHRHQRQCQHRQQKAAGEHIAGNRHRRRQQTVRIDQAQTQEQIMLQQPGPGGAFARPQLLHQALGAARSGDRQQPGGGGEAQERGDVGLLGADRRFLGDGLRDPRAVADAPAGQDFELQPADPQEAVAGGIVDGPTGGAVGRGRTGHQPQVLSQRRQRGRAETGGGYSASHCRTIAMGRRSSQTARGCRSP